MDQKIVEVAVGVLIDDKGRFLMASRLEGKPYAGWWEFPGGKLEAGETVSQALSREFNEELGIKVQKSAPWFVLERVYPHGHVRLHFERILSWIGSVDPKEGQEYQWFAGLEEANSQKILPMCDIVIRRLALPAVICISSDPQPDAVVKSAEETVSESYREALFALIDKGAPARDILAAGLTRLPLYVHAPAEELRHWIELGAHGVWI